jgi:TPR repeat protein
VRTGLATLILAVGLVCTWAYAKRIDGDKFDPGKFEEYKAKAVQGDAWGQAMLGRCYATGQGVEQNPTEAVKWFRKSADQDDARGQCGLGNCYAMGMGVKKDVAEAVKWFRKSAEQGYAGGQCGLGFCYAMGMGVKKDVVESVKWYRKAAEQGDADGQSILGSCYARGAGVAKDVAEAVKWFRKAAEQGCAEAQSNLGVCYRNGEGVEEDFAEAVKLFRKAADQGNANGQYNLGACYGTGDGVAKDLAEAVKWYRKAAEQGHVAAQYNLGRRYYQGEGVAKDAAEAVKWLHKAAEQGEPDAQYSMGRCYATGEGVERDEVEAYKWMLLAVSQGNVSAKQAITLLERQLTKAQRVEGRQRASTFKPPAGPGVIQTPAKRQILRVVVLPFHNATGDAAWDAWRQAFPALVRMRLNGAEFTRIPGWKTIQPALVNAGWTGTGAMDAKLARRIALELNADVAVWGSFRHLPKGWSLDARVLDLNSEAVPAELHFTSRQWLELTNSLALGLAKQLDRPIATDEQELWKMQLTDSEKAAECLAKAIALEVLKAPAAEQEQEQAWRDALAADPRCGCAHAALCRILRKSERKDDWEKAVREFVAQQPRWCGAHLARAGLRWRDDKEDAEREVREALELHPGCPEALLGMFAVLSKAGRWVELTKVLEQARADHPHDPATAVFLAAARAQSGNLKGARELLDQMGELPEENETVDLVLLQVASAAGELELAGRVLLRLGPQAAESEAIRDTLATFKHVFPADDGSSKPPLVRPRSFGPRELDAELSRRLTAEERKWVVNPLEITPEITAEAKRLTIGLTNDSLRAWALFAEVTRRGRGAGEGRRRTADEALQDSADPQTGFSCQDYAKLYVALARALGLDAWLVHIERCADGTIGYHDCAALFLEGRGVLVDPTWRAFGIRHEAFTVLDDAQAISHQAMQPGDGAPDLQRLRMGLKLNPEDRWTRLHFVRGMAEAGECETAAAELQQVRADGTESWDTHQAAAALEMARGRWQAALEELQLAVALNPDNAGIHSGLVKVYNHLGDSAKSSEHKERVLALDRGELSQDSRRQLALEIGFMKASARANSDEPAVQAELQKQAKGGDVAAIMALAQACAEAQPPRSKDSVRWLLLAAAQNHAQAQYNLGIHYFAGEGVAKRDVVKAVEWLSKAAELNHADAQYNLGVCYLQGQGVVKDEVKAVEWLRKAAGQNHPTAQYNLGCCYLQGQGVAKDEVEAVKWFRKAAGQNHPTAQYNLGVCYLQGQGVEKDDVEAYKWMLLAVAQGDATAKQGLRLLEPKLTQQQRAEGQQRASAFELPEVPSSDIMQGGSGSKPLADLHAKAAGGDPTAQHDLGEAFQAGKLGVVKNPVEAVKWFKMAAVQNFAPAQNCLGVCYERGEGVAKHELEAYKWYLLAAAQGNENATDNASLLELLLSPDQIAEGKRRAVQFKPQERTEP